MTRDEVLSELCKIMAMVYHSIADYSAPSDGICHECPTQRSQDSWQFRNDGHIVEYIKEATRQRLLRDGYTIHSLT